MHGNEFANHNFDLISDELVETVQTGLKALCNDLPQGKFVFRNNTGDKPFRKSWVSETLTKAFGISKTTHGLGAAGALRKSVERYGIGLSMLRKKRARTAPGEMVDAT